jgi:hypothetical protein
MTSRPWTRADALACCLKSGQMGCCIAQFASVRQRCHPKQTAQAGKESIRFNRFPGLNETGMLIA